MLFNLENFIENLAFCLLFLTMLFYWIAIGSAKTSKMSLIARSTLILANSSLFVFLLLRWKESGHFPLSNLYESLIFLAWSLTFIQIFIENKNATKLLFPLGSSLDASATLKSNSSLGKEASFIGAIIAPSALLTYAFATFSLPTEMQKTSALVPALQSNWLVMHVTIMILSYAALICGCLLSIAFLIITRNDNDSLAKSQSNLIVQLNSTSGKLGGSVKLSSLFFSEAWVYRNRPDFDSEGTTSLLPSIKQSSLFFSEAKKKAETETTNLENNLVLNTTLENNMELQTLPTTNLSSIGTGTIAKNLDNLSYRILGIGFPLLTIGILSGSVWANEAWGSYWSWDPKETWALLTWLVFAIYLHTRLTKGWEGKKPAIIASFGFIIVWVCFIGVNLLGKGLHSYGWLS